METPIQARNKGDLIRSEDGRIVSKQLCTSAYHFASILSHYALDPFARKLSIPLSEVKSAIGARS